MANDQMEGMENKLAGADGFVVFLLLLWFIYICQSDPALCQTRCAAGRLQKTGKTKKLRQLIAARRPISILGIFHVYESHPN